MPIDANRAYLLRSSIAAYQRAAGRVLTLGVKPLAGDETLFSDLGYSGVESVDVSSFEGCTHIADLNKPVPRHLCDRYGLVYNGGTIEHIFDVRAVLRNIHEMLKVDGVVVHVGPMNGWVEHGFYQFSPTIFADYYHANGYEALPAFVLKAVSLDHLKLEVHDYSPGQLDNSQAGSFSGVWNFFMPFIKRSNSSWDVIPQQGYYTRLYGDPEIAVKARAPHSDSFMLVDGVRLTHSSNSERITSPRLTLRDIIARRFGSRAR